MAEVPSWHIMGDWFDNCSCAVACPCTFAQAPDNRLLRVGAVLADPAGSRDDGGPNDPDTAPALARRLVTMGRHAR